MAPNIATSLFILGIIGLFILNKEPELQTSKGLWIPVVWLLINGSRPVSVWLQSQPMHNVQNADVYLEGSPLDASIYSLLLLAGLLVLVRRRSEVGELLRRNAPILLFFSYCAVSVLWSDYTEVSFKRWVKAISDLVMVLIVLTDTAPILAISRLLTRVSFILVPASVLLIKYYPTVGRKYIIVNISTWETMSIGVTDHKNTLGMVCMILGLGVVWCFLEEYRGHGNVRRKKHLLAQGVVIAMIVWLLVQANSITALMCFILATGFIVLVFVRGIARRRWLTYLLMAVVVAIPVAILFLGVARGTLTEVGRDATLTGRTDIWRQVVRMSGSAMFGAGFESFWLGNRVERLWQIFDFHPTQAHNGYIEVYLELGWLGLGLLALVILTGLRNAVRSIRCTSTMGRIRLTFIVAGLAYNLSEAGFRMLTLTWFFFLLSVVVVPVVALGQASTEVRAAATRDVNAWQAVSESSTCSREIA